jgi:phosphoribosyl 1,2-cyclic phosphate phosphodiesterase
VPVIACQCNVCLSNNPKDNRLRSSVLVEVDNVRFVIDAGPDFRQQMLREKVTSLDAVVFTHSHKDHIAGLDDVRAFNYVTQLPMNVFASLETQHALRREYAYVFDNPNYPGIPQINLNTIQNNLPFSINGVEIIPIKVAHYEMDVLGFRMHDFTYITDANFISSEEIEKIKGSRVLVLNALRHEKHISHYTLSEAIEIARYINPEKTFFTHISHQLGKHDEVATMLPDNMNLAYDGLQVFL